MAYKKPLVITGGQQSQLQLADSLVVRAAVNPTAADDAYSNGTQWQNTVSLEIFELIDNTPATAVWVSLTAGGGGFSGLTEFVVNTGTGNIDSIPCGTDPLVCIVFTGAAPVVEGIAAGASGKRVILKKVGAGNLVIKQMFSATPADNLALNTSNDITLLPNEAIELVYTSAGPFWVHITSAIAPTGGGGVSANVAIYDPDIGATSGNRYKTWAEVMVAVAAWGPVGGELAVRKAGVIQTAVVPAGTYDLSNVFLRSDASSILPVLSFADGCTLSGFPKVIEGVILEGNNDTVSAAPLYTVSGFGISLLRDGAIRNSTTATQPVISVPTGANFTLNADTGTPPLYKNGGGVAVFVEGTLSFDVWRIPENSFFSDSGIFTNALSGIGTININTRVLIPGGYTRTDANYNGTMNVNHFVEQRVQEKIDFLEHGAGATLTDTTNGIAIGSFAASAGTKGIAVGAGASSTGNNSIAIGPNNNVAWSDNDIAIGFNAKTGISGSSGDNIVIGSYSYISGTVVYGALIIGSSSFVDSTADYAVAVGYSANAMALEAMAFGLTAYANYARSIAMGRFSATNAVDSVAIGSHAFTGAGATGAVAIGDHISARVAETTKLKPIINDTQVGEGFKHSGGVETVLTCEELDMVAGTFVELTLPSGCHFYPNEVGLITSQANTVTGAGTAKFGTSVSDAAISASLAPDQTQFNRTRDVAPLTINGVTSLRATVLSAATATTLKVRPYFKGLLVKD